MNSPPWRLALIPGLLAAYFAVIRSPQFALCSSLVPVRKQRFMSRPVLAPRFTAIDETRTLAILSIIIKHFGPSAFQRLPTLQPLAELILFLGRFATTPFIRVFGVTVGFVYFDRFRGPNRQQVIDAVHARSRLLGLCALIICVPEYLNLWLAGDFKICVARFERA